MIRITMPFLLIGGLLIGCAPEDSITKRTVASSPVGAEASKTEVYFDEQSGTEIELNAAVVESQATEQPTEFNARAKTDCICNGVKLKSCQPYFELKCSREKATQYQLCYAGWLCEMTWKFRWKNTK